MYGPRRNASVGFVDKTLKWLADGKVLKIADDKIDSPTYSLDAAKAILALIEDGQPWGLWHVANNGIVSYYEFVSRLASLLGFENRIERAKDQDFPGLAPKPLFTALASEKLPPLRRWEDALTEYVSQVLQINSNKL